MINDYISQALKEEMNLKTERCSPCGKGASGSVYTAECENGFKAAVKVSEYPKLMEEEYDSSKFLLEKSGIKIPKPYFFKKYNDGEKELGIFAMEYIDGVSADNIWFKFRGKKKRENYVSSILENLNQLQSVENEKFGNYKEAVYESWDDYYKPFAENILKFAEAKGAEKALSKEVLDVMETAFAQYEKIFDEKPQKAVLTHGDFWTPNIIVDKNTLTMKGLIDPFMVKWADRDYELFALKAGAGGAMGLYEEYKKRYGVSEKADVKTEFYALFSEMYWYSRLGKVSHPFLKLKANCLKKEMKKFGIV